LRVIYKYVVVRLGRLVKLLLIKAQDLDKDCAAFSALQSKRSSERGIFMLKEKTCLESLLSIAAEFLTS
jgi:hypothetical protein